MKSNIDLKSIITGLVVGIAVMLVLGAESRSNYNGRYQVSSAQGFAVIVDSQTGQAWGFGTANTTQFRNDPNFWDVK